MDQSKLDVAKEEMVGVNTVILGISELNGKEWENLTQMTILSTDAG